MSQYFLCLLSFVYYKIRVNRPGHLALLYLTHSLFKNRAAFFQIHLKKGVKVSKSRDICPSCNVMPTKDEEDQDQGPRWAKLFCLAQTLSPFLQVPTAVFPVSCMTNDTQGSSNAPTSQSWIKMNSSSHLCIIHYHYSFYPVSWQCVWVQGQRWNDSTKGLDNSQW